MTQELKKGFVQCTPPKALVLDRIDTEKVNASKRSYVADVFCLSLIRMSY